MSRIQIPLVARTLWATGDVLLRAQVPLLVRTSSQKWRRFTFRYDSGSEITTMPAARAKRYRLPFPQNPVPGLAMITPAGRVPEVRAGMIKIQIMGMDGTEYWIPCYFLGDPNAPLPSTQISRTTANVLGLSGVVDKLRIITDGTPTLGADYGNVIVEKIVP